MFGSNDFNCFGSLCRPHYDGSYEHVANDTRRPRPTAQAARLAQCVINSTPRANYFTQVKEFENIRGLS